MKLPALILISLLLACDAWGCSITVRRPLKFVFQDAKYVFVGKVKTAERWSVTFEVTEQFAGEPVSVVTLRTSNSCAVSEFAADVPYLVDVTEDVDGSLMADQGGYTHALVSANDPKLQLVRRRARWWKSRLSRISLYRFRHWLGRRIAG